MITVYTLLLFSGCPLPLMFFLSFSLFLDLKATRSSTNSTPEFDDPCEAQAHRPRGQILRVLRARAPRAQDIVQGRVISVFRQRCSIVDRVEFYTDGV